jgi:hypothetical protein
VIGLEGRAVADLSPMSPGSAGTRYLDGRRDGVDPHFERPVLGPHPATGEEVLFAHLYQPAFQYLHQWAAHDLVIWDNRALQHSRPHIGTTELRILVPWRTKIHPAMTPILPKKWH